MSSNLLVYTINNVRSQIDKKIDEFFQWCPISLFKNKAEELTKSESRDFIMEDSLQIHIPKSSLH